MLVSLPLLQRVRYCDNDDFASVTADTLILLDGAGTPAGQNPGCIHGVTGGLPRQLWDAVPAESAKDIAPIVAMPESRHPHVRDRIKTPVTSRTLALLSSTVVAVLLDSDCADIWVLADSVLCSTYHGR